MVDDSDKFSQKRWRQAQLLANHYWKRWLREYIPSLQERQKWHKTQRNLQTGELVLITDDNVPRHQWPIGRVTNVFPGSDGLVSLSFCRGSRIEGSMSRARVPCRGSRVTFFFSKIFFGKGNNRCNQCH